MIDRAAEALRATAPSKVRLDATTAGLLDARFVLAEPLPGEHGERILLGEIEPLSRGRLVGGRLSPFVGRERECLLLDAWLRETVRRRGGPAASSCTASPAWARRACATSSWARWMATQPEVRIVSGSLSRARRPRRGPSRSAAAGARGDTAEPVEFRRTACGRGWASRCPPRPSSGRPRSWRSCWGSPGPAPRRFIACRSPGAPRRRWPRPSRGRSRTPCAACSPRARWRWSSTTASGWIRGRRPSCTARWGRLQISRSSCCSSAAGRPRTAPSCPASRPVVQADLALPPLSEVAADRLVAAMLGGPPESRAPLVRRAGGHTLPAGRADPGGGGRPSRRGCPRPCWRWSRRASPTCARPPRNASCGPPASSASRSRGRPSRAFCRTSPAPRARRGPGRAGRGRAAGRSAARGGGSPRRPSARPPTPCSRPRTACGATPGPPSGSAPSPPARAGRSPNTWSRRSRCPWRRSISSRPRR